MQLENVNHFLRRLYKLFLILRKLFNRKQMLEKVIDLNKLPQKKLTMTEFLRYNSNLKMIHRF